MAPLAPTPSPTADLASLWSEFPFTEELGAVKDTLLGIKDRVLDLAVDHPAEALITLVLGSAWVLYQAEKDVNEGINTYDDAVYYTSTCLSVGYANVFPVTQTGKFVAALVMMVGPFLSGWMVEGRLVARQKAQETPPAPAPAPVRTPPVRIRRVTRTRVVMKQVRVR